jgi:hypothetical protein
MISSFLIVEIEGVKGSGNLFKGLRKKNHSKPFKQHTSSKRTIKFFLILFSVFLSPFL